MAPKSDSNSALVALAPQLEALDKFAEDNNLSVLTEGKGAFTAAIAVADAIGQLKAKLTDEVMQPIKQLQGTALGFKTDKDNAGGYPVEVIREVFIEATLKGFKMVGNQTNIIAGRFYATKEGFEDFFLRQARAGKFTDYRDTYSVPKLVTADEAIVTVTATWKWEGKADKFDSTPISIRVNKGQGADAILGKAKRKLLARIYSRVTGTVITEGDANEPAIDVTVTPTPGDTGQAASGANPPPEGLSDEVREKLTKILEPHAELANKWLAEQGSIQAGQTYLDVSEKLATKIINQSGGFLTAIGAKA